MSQSTITIMPIPAGTTEDKVNQILQAFNIVRVHISGDVAYVEFDDASDIESLQFAFSDLTIPKLNGAQINKAQNFDWSIFHSKPQSLDETEVIVLSHVDESSHLMPIDKNNLVVVKNCDQNTLKHLTIPQIKQIFSHFKSIYRIVKNQTQVIVQFLDVNEIELLEMEFDNLRVPKLGPNSQIDKVDLNFKTQDFMDQWSKVNTQQSQLTQATTNLGQRQQQAIFVELNQSPSKQVLHNEILPSLNKVTSMEQQFLLEQSRQKKPIKQQNSIKQQNTHQQLDFPSQTQIPSISQKKQESVKNDQAQKRQEQIIHQHQLKQQDDVKFILEDQDNQKQLLQKRKAQLIQHQAKEKEELRRQQLQNKERQEEQQKRNQEARQKKQIQRIQKQMQQSKKKAEQQAQLQKEKENQRVGKQQLEEEQKRKVQLKKKKEEDKKILQQKQKLLLQSKKNQSEIIQVKLQQEKQWNVRPDVAQMVENNSAQSKKSISQTLITVTLLVWVLFLLIQ